METSESSSEPGRRSDGGPPICAIGASAGGVEALQALFESLPTDLGFAYVVVVHLAVDHPSHLPEILAQRTAMPVQGVHATTVLEADHVYTNVPGHGLFLVDGAVTSRPFAEDGPRWTPIDGFLESLAAGPAGDAVVLILSGAGRDGTLGARAVKAAGGLVLVQDPAEAAYAPMPESVRGAGVADLVAPLAELIRRLGELAARRRAPPPATSATADLGPLLRLLRRRTGHDLSTYKPATLLRRIARRRQVTRCADLDAYTAHVRDHPEEADRLLRDLLISVTSFFRDPQAFDALAERVLPELFDRLGDDEPLRAWVAGCATGEEAYGLAALLLEARALRRPQAAVQIFASDLDDEALAIARAGRYPAGIAADVTPDRLRRFFKQQHDTYTVRKELRELVLFTKHDLLRDPPFLRLDLIACRNLLIYLDRDAQEQLTSLFHYALKPGGCLFLGSAESVDAPELFDVVQRDARLYRARPYGGRSLPPLPDVAGSPPAPTPAAEAEVTPARSGAGGTAAAHLAALEAAAPPSALVDDGQNVLHLSPTAGRFLMPSAGPVSSELSVLVRPELRVDVKSGLERALERHEPMVTLPIVVDFEGVAHRVVVHVQPLPVAAGGAARALVLFIDGGAAAAATAGPAAASADLVQDLRDELAATRERLQASREQQHQTVQELRAANEELQSINEEYRSTSEELEISKEELQSMNEELQTVNAELRRKLDSISSANSDLQNLMQTTEIATLFLDTGLRIRMFTPRVTDHFHLTDADVGRAITDFANRLVDIDVERDAAIVLRELAPVEREVATADDRWLTMRLRPYRTVDDRIDGVVVTFVDVTARRAAEAELRASEERYRALFESIGDGVLVAEVLRDERGRAVDLYYLDLNPAGRAIVPSPLVGRRLSEIRPAFEAYWWDIPARVARTGEPERHELYAGPLTRWYEIYVWRLDAESDRVAILFRDTTERRRALDALEATRGLLEIATAASGLGRITVDMAHGTVRSDQRARDILGLTREEIALAKFRARLHDDDRATVERELEARAHDGARFDLTARLRTGDGRERRARFTGVFEQAGDPRTARATALVGAADGDPAGPRR